MQEQDLKKRIWQRSNIDTHMDCAPETEWVHMLNGRCMILPIIIFHHVNNY